MTHQLQCRCGTLRGFVSPSHGVNRCVCYCRDCQAFAHFLGRANEILDASGGTDVIQARAANVVFTEGREALACMRLTPNGMLRWYSTCCKTPVGNTTANSKVSFVGLVHTCLEGAGPTLDDSFGPVQAYVNTQSAKGGQKSNPLALVAVILRVVGIVARARIDGSYRRSPFFSADTGAPIVAPKVLSPGEREHLMSAL
jgi:Family of unknown function (DUF6151)